jgi:hypothetical protein
MGRLEITAQRLGSVPSAILANGLNADEASNRATTSARAPVNVDDMSRQQTAPAVNCRLNEKTRPKYIEQW